MTEHTHDDDRLTIGCPGCINTQYEPAINYPEGASLTVRRTMRNAHLIAAGVHPATGKRLLDGASHCGDCAHHSAVTHYSSRLKIWHKCDLHRLGQSHSDASDIRVSWPACVAFEPLVAGGESHT